MAHGASSQHQESTGGNEVIQNPILKGVTCPRCNGTGNERGFPWMTCGGCRRKGVTQEELCPYCLHPVSEHTLLKNLGIHYCEAESRSGQFICGCQADSHHAKSTCNVCGRDFGNLYCLERHLEESNECKKKFEKQYY